jgi:hypothetical protein
MSWSGGTWFSTLARSIKEDVISIARSAASGAVTLCRCVWDPIRAEGSKGAEENYTLSDALAVASWLNVFVRKSWGGHQGRDDVHGLCDTSHADVLALSDKDVQPGGSSPRPTPTDNLLRRVERLGPHPRRGKQGRRRKLGALASLCADGVPDVPLVEADCRSELVGGNLVLNSGESSVPLIDMHSIHLYTSSSSHLHNVTAPLAAERAIGPRRSTRRSRLSVGVGRGELGSQLWRDRSKRM